MVGPGNGVWNYVHVLDLVHFYVALMNEMLQSPPEKEQSLEGFYFVESGEFVWKDLFKAVADAMVDMKALEPYKEMGTFSAEDLKKYMEGDATWAMLGSNARCRAERAKALGWKPTQPDLFKTVAEDVARAYHAKDLVR
jgi:nucleoside-diphosphate-sugar epimerase